MNKKTKVLITNFIKRDIVSQILESRYDVHESENYIGNKVFMVHKDHAGDLSEIIAIGIERGDLDKKASTVTKVQGNFPSEIGKRFLPTRLIDQVVYTYAKDGKAVCDPCYSWLITEFLGSSIHGDIPSKPFSIVKDGHIIGATMLCNPRIIADEAREATHSAKEE